MSGACSVFSAVSRFCLAQQALSIADRNGGLRVVSVRCKGVLCFNVNLRLCSGFRLAVGDGFVYTAKGFLAGGDFLNGFCAQICGVYGLDSGFSSMSVWVCSG